MQGLDLVGTASKSKFFDTRLSPASASPDFALLTARWQRHKMEARDVHAKTMSCISCSGTILCRKLMQVLEGPFHNFGHVRQVLGCTSMTVSRLSAIALKHPNRCVQIVMKDGSILSGTLHKDIDAKQEWKGRCIDLSKVYKRVPVSLRSRPLFSAHGPPL